jgi:phenylacetate-CoA ligase
MTLSTKAELALSSLRDYYAADLDALLVEHARTDPEAHVLSFFRGVVRDVPAYRRFLSARAFDAESVRSLADFARVPATTKAEYHREFPLPELCRQGALDALDFVAVSSGSTGEPAVWPRFVSDEIGSTLRFEQVLADAFEAKGKKTLAVVCFALGSWVGGMYTTFACRHVAAKGYPITLVTPGSNRTEILRVIRALGPLFEQVVLLGYPPFLKDVIDAGRADGLDFRRFQLRFVTAGEVFSEEWRALVCERAGVADPPRATASLYGTADGGVLANETPLSIEIRRHLSEHPAAARELFGESRLPTLCQYDPFHRYFECNAGDLLFSGDGGAPLVRYRILDRGGLLTHAELLRFAVEHGFRPSERAKGAGGRELPFVYVFGRSNFALSFYGANVYPENVSVGLEQSEIAPYVSGKFVMEIAHDADHNAELHVTVELAPKIEPRADFEASVARTVRLHLERLNSEFSNYVPAERRSPSVKLLPAGHPEYFPAGVKHRYTRG